jgi:hypothetical protein
MSDVSTWKDVHRELDRWADCGITATFWVRDDDAWTVSDELKGLSAFAKRHELNIGLAVIPGKLSERLVRFLEIESTHFYPMCHGWRHVDYGREGRPAEFGRDRPFTALYDDGRQAFERFIEYFEKVEAIFVPPFGRITNAMVNALPQIGFAGVSKGPSVLERRLSRIVSRLGWTPVAKLPTKKLVPHFDVQIDLIDSGDR